MSVLITGAAEVVTGDPALGVGPAGVLERGAVVVEGDQIVWVGRQSQAPAADSVIDLGGATLIPGFVDSHSHLVFAGDRSHEFTARMAGEP